MSRLLLVAGAGLTLAVYAFGQATPAAPLSITFDDALKRAQTVSPQLLSAEIASKLAREDRVQAKSAMLPTVGMLNQFIYTQPNGRDSGVFISNDGPHLYNNQAVVHGEIFSAARRAEYRVSIAAEAAAQARAEIAARGVRVAVTESFYGLVSAQRKNSNAQLGLKEAEQFLDITRKQESGGEVARADVVKAEVQVEQRRRDAQDTDLAMEKARVGLAVLIFPDFRQDFTVVDDLGTAPALAPLAEVQAAAGKNNPDIRAAQETVRQETYGVKAARAEWLPSLSADYFFGINARQFAVHDPENFRNLGSSFVAELTLPVFNWGATRSRIRQAELRLQQARSELTLAQRELLGNLRAFYLEADSAAMQLASLRRSADLAAESVRLTLLGYQAGEATVLEVVDAQATLIQARNAADDGLLRYRLALANLQTLTGAF